MESPKKSQGKNRNVLDSEAADYAVAIANLCEYFRRSGGDLTGAVDEGSDSVSLAHPSAVTSSGGISTDTGENSDIVPIVYVSENRDVMIAMKVNGITCAHCVKIVETVLKGCNGNKSPITGLIDAAADRTMSAVLIRVDSCMNAKRISLEATRNLAMVGYTARAMTMSMTVEKNGIPTKMPQDEVDRAFEAIGALDPNDIFDWSAPCTCPDSGVAREDCMR